MKPFIYIAALLFCLPVYAQDDQEHAHDNADAALLDALQQAAGKDRATTEAPEHEPDVSDGHQHSEHAHKTHHAHADDNDLLAPVNKRLGEIMGNETNPSIAIILDTAGAYFGSRARIRQGGHAPVTNGPTIQGAELSASASIDPYFKLDMSFGMYHLHLEEIYLTTMSLPMNLQLRAGKFKSNIGRHNPTHLHSWNFVTPPLANEFLFGAEGMSLPGVELSFLFPLPWYVEIVGALQAGQARGFRTHSTQFGDPGFKDFVYPLRLAQFFDFTDNFGMQLGLNSVLGTSDIAPETGNRTYAYGADLFFKWRPLNAGRTGHFYVAFTTESWLRQMEVPDDVWTDLGLYSDLIVGLSKRWNMAVRGQWWRSLGGAQPVARDNYGMQAVKYTGNVSFMPSHFSRLRLEYSVDFPNMYPVNHTVMLQLEVSAGAHKAHGY